MPIVESKLNSLSVIVPIYNEEKNINIFLPDIIKYCSDLVYDLILVNDGSIDSTEDILKNYKISKNVKIINHKLNKGYGAAIKLGIENADTEYCITIDADGQHQLEDIEKLFKKITETDADMIVGSRKGNKVDSLFRKLGKFLIRSVAKLLMPLKIYDINSGMKIYRTELAKKYMHLYPDTMAFSDIICLVFVHNRHLVLEEPIIIKKREKGKSTIGINDAVQTFYEIINIIMLFSPMRIFLPISFLLFISGMIWGIRFFVQGLGISMGGSLLIISSLIIFLIGLLAEQMSSIRKHIK